MTTDKILGTFTKTITKLRKRAEQLELRIQNDIALVEAAQADMEDAQAERLRATNVMQKLEEFTV